MEPIDIAEISELDVVDDIPTSQGAVNFFNFFHDNFGFEAHAAWEYAHTATQMNIVFFEELIYQYMNDESTLEFMYPSHLHKLKRRIGIPDVSLDSSCDIE